MKKVFLLLAVLASLLVGVSSCAQTQPEEALPQKEGTFRIEVSRNGFNKTPGEFRLEVEEGQEVEITFIYGDKGFPQNNPHIIAIPEYGIETGVIDENNPEQTVSFTASKTGEVSFVCTQTSCVGHTNLQGGTIIVQP